MSIRYEQYLNALYTDYTPITRIDFLYPDGSVAYRITDDVIQSGSTLNVSTSKDKLSGTRRTATLIVDNWKRAYDLHPDKIWFGQQIKISKGLYLRDGSEYLLPQGIFYITNPSEAFAPSERTNTLSLIDKWAYLDGTLFGNIPGTYILSIDDDLLTAIAQLLLTDRGNGIVLDNLSPVLDVAYLTKSYVSDSTTYLYKNCPYTAKIKGTYGDVLSEIATMLVANIWYDATGRLHAQSANADVADNVKPILWNFGVSDRDREFVRVNLSQHPEKAYNHVVVTGGTLNGHVARGEATITDPRSGMNISRIGKKTAPLEEQSKYFADEHCQELAEYRLSQYQLISEEATIECSPMFHLQEDCLVTVQRSGIDETRIPYLINGWSLPLGNTGTMTINASKLTIPSDFRTQVGTTISYPSGLLYSGTP